MDILTIIRWIAFVALTALWFVIATFNTYTSFRGAFFSNGKGQSAIPLIGTFAAGFALWAFPIDLPHLRQLSISFAIFFAEGTWIIFAIVGNVYRRLKNKE